jgi:hypothetical protein
VFFRLDDFAAALVEELPMPFTPEDALANLSACHQFYTVALRD